MVRTLTSPLNPMDLSPLPHPLQLLAQEVHSCRRCPRLADFLASSRQTHPAYWSRPVSGFGDPGARVFILGLAPGFHGANQHGRVFTGDDSGRWLWGALHELGVCSVPNCTRGDQPVELSGVWISNAVRCVPPQNRPTTEELTVCRDFLARELELFPQVQVVLALGKLAHDSYLKLRGANLSASPFAHGAVHRLAGDGPLLVDSYHPSRQNTNTGVLKWEMWTSVLRDALHLAQTA
jgi:uracil-DNA glycosylase family 4